MVGATAAADAVRRARALPDLRVGLHVVLADGDAVLAPKLIPGLADAAGRMDGRMWSRGLRYFAMPRIRRQLESEIRAQFSAFARTGLPLDHVNVHKHFHLHPTLLGMLLRIGREFGVRAMRVPDEPFWFAARHGGWAGGASATALRPWVALMKARLRTAGLAHNDRIFGIAASGDMDETRLLEVMARLPRGVTEIYLHPAAAGHVISSSMRGYHHAEELEALLSPRVRIAIAQAGVVRGGYGDLPPQRYRA
jgi:hopanoid biosynthesis associated protein HpnK